VVLKSVVLQFEFDICTSSTIFKIGQQCVRHWRAMKWPFLGQVLYNAYKFLTIQRSGKLCSTTFLRIIYRLIQEESAILWKMIVCVILSKKVHMNMGPILNGYRDMVKRRYGPSCVYEQQLRNK